MTGFWRAEAGALLVRVKMQPKARRPGLQAPPPSADGRRLRVAVGEAPEDGRAHRAVCASLAAALGVPMSAVAIAQGAAAREKTLRVLGELAALVPGIEALA